MIAYHGSDSNFKTLRISRKLVKRNSTLDNEGLGIYFSTDISVARSYGKYLYTLEINDDVIRDFKKQATCQNYVNHICHDIKRQTGINIWQYLDTKQTILRLKTGGLAVSGVGQELYLLLDANADWYHKNTGTKIEAVYRLLKSCDRHCPKAYLFRYNIPDIGIIKDVSPEIVQIIKKERSY